MGRSGPRRTSVVGAGAVGLAAVFAAAVTPATVDAQSSFCFRPSPLPECRWSPILEMRGGWVLHEGERPVLRSVVGGTSQAVEVSRDLGLEGEFGWNVGLSVNLTPSWAVGATLDVSSWAQDGFAGGTVRVRRWLDDPDWALELEGRYAEQAEGFILGDAARSYGLGVRASWRDLVTGWVRTDLVDRPRAVLETDFVREVDEGGWTPVTMAGLSLGREPGVVASAVYFIGLWILFQQGAFE